MNEIENKRHQYADEALRRECHFEAILRGGTTYEDLIVAARAQVELDPSPANWALLQEVMTLSGNS